MRTALTIAGSDSGGGAGIQADLKTFAAHRVYGTSALTAVTAQNTRGVTAWQALPPELVRAQIDAVMSDIGADAVKIGMLGEAAIVAAVADAIDAWRFRHVVLDPVMTAKGGDWLLAAPAIDALRTRLLPRCTVLTPNIPEAEVLTGLQIRSLDDMYAAARAIRGLGSRTVLLKGGHGEGAESVDVACTPEREFEIRGPRLSTRSTHGTGCTLSSAIAANLANGMTEEDALRGARAYLEGALRAAPPIGGGHGPLGHMWRLY
jgi:hydroxymethylpyrimidine/phosphomethylpyrimidine kinase